MNPIEIFKKQMPNGCKFTPPPLRFNPLYPRAVTPGTLYFPFEREPFKLDRRALFLAQQLTRFARNCSPSKAEKYVNKANYILTAAYMGGDAQSPFWGQF